MHRQAFLPLLPLLRLFRLVLACLLTLSVMPLQAASIVVVLSESGPAYQAYAKEFRARLEKHGTTELLILDAGQLGGAPLPEASLLVAVGNRAAEMLVSRDLRQPLLLTMLPRASLERLLALQPKAGGIYIDQPATRYMALVRAALPETDRIGLLIGRDSKDTAARLLSAARDNGCAARRKPFTVRRTFTQPCNAVSDGGALLATPDSSVFNAQTIPSILLSAYRRRVPVVGFSPAYVSAAPSSRSTPRRSNWRHNRQTSAFTFSPAVRCLAHNPLATTRSASTSGSPARWVLRWKEKP